jgi:site-specific recombinase XerD
VATCESLIVQIVPDAIVSELHAKPARLSVLGSEQLEELGTEKPQSTIASTQIVTVVFLRARTFIEYAYPIIEFPLLRCYTDTNMAKRIDKLINDYLEYLEIERGRSQLTIRNYDFYLRRFSKWAKHPEPDAITDDLVHRYRLWLNRSVKGRDGEPIKKTTQNYHLIALRSLLKYFAKKDIQSLAAEKIELAKHEQREVSFMEANELDRLLAAPMRMSEGLVALRDHAILELLFSTGMRVSEISQLKIEQINLERDEFTVRGKGGKLRAVYLSSTAKDSLKNYLAKRRDASPFLIVGHDRAKGGRKPSGGLTPRSIQRLVERYAKNSGITKHVTPHTLRHTFATDLLLGGADIRSVQSLLGHASITTTQIYTHITNKQMKEVHKKFHGKSRKTP